MESDGRMRERERIANVLIISNRFVSWDLLANSFQGPCNQHLGRTGVFGVKRQFLIGHGGRERLAERAKVHASGASRGVAWEAVLGTVKKWYEPG